MSDQSRINGDGDSVPNSDTESAIVLEHISSGRVLLSILVLVVLYVFSKWLVSQQEPNIRVDGNFRYFCSK